MHFIEPMPENLHSILESARDVAVHAALEAGRLIQASAGRVRGGDVREKQHANDLVTAVDLAAQELLVDRLARWDATATVLAEEGDLAEGSERVEGFRWIIDPLDGTTNFTHGMPPYAVSIGLQHDGQTVAGVVLDVSRWELFTVIRGGGVFVNGVRAAVSGRRTLAESLLATGFPYRRFEYVDEFLGLLGAVLQASRGVRRTGAAAVDLACVACGRLEGFFETGLNAWDMAAGALMVEEAGGRVTDYAGRPDVLFGRQILATNGRIHDEMLEKVAAMQDVRI